MTTVIAIAALLAAFVSVVAWRRESRRRLQSDESIRAIVDAIEQMRLAVGKCFTYGDMCKEIDRVISEHRGQCPALRKERVGLN
ncbi:MAG: hypothetical protein WC551_13585 [Patescibacteria group bacterium]